MSKTFKVEIDNWMINAGIVSFLRYTSLDRRSYDEVCLTKGLTVTDDYIEFTPNLAAKVIENAYTDYIRKIITGMLFFQKNAVDGAI